MRIKTPRQFAIFLTLILSILVGLISGLTQVFFYKNINGWMVLISTGITAVLGYLVIFYLLEKLITQKIRMLYRTIHSFKISKGDFSLKMGEDVLDKSEREIISWGQDNRKEIEKLKLQENFRREFIGNLAHELRTPAFNIQGYILTLLEGGLEDESINRRFLKRAAKGVERMTSLLEDIDVISRIESDNVELKMNKVDIVDLAEEIMESFEIKAQEKNIAVKFAPKPNDSLFVKCDRDKIAQVLTNLINNSVNYGDDGGYVKVRFIDYEDNILVEVSDNGIGIDEEHLPRLFERFYRVDKSRSRHEGGTGLGLAIAKHIVEAHDQMINVRSSSGEGTTLSFTLEKYRNKG